MRVAEGAAFSYELMFTGAAPATVTYTVLGNNGVGLVGYTNLTSAVPPGAVSHVLTIPAATSTVAAGYFENRALAWSYPGASGVVRYRVDKLLPFAVSPDGVRAKLGVFDEELPDEDIDLTGAYLRFVAPISNQAGITAAATAGDITTLKVLDAIEAMAALVALPTLQLRLAKMRSSGTNKFERQLNPDWDLLRASLNGLVDAGVTAIDVPVETTGDNGLLMGFSIRTDPITG